MGHVLGALGLCMCQTCIACRRLLSWRPKDFRGRGQYQPAAGYNRPSTPFIRLQALTPSSLYSGKKIFIRLQVLTLSSFYSGNKNFLEDSPCNPFRSLTR